MTTIAPESGGWNVCDTMTGCGVVTNATMRSHFFCPRRGRQPGNMSDVVNKLKKDYALHDGKGFLVARPNPTHQRDNGGAVEVRFHNFHLHDRFSGVFLTGETRRYDMFSSESRGDGELELGSDDSGVVAEEVCVRRSRCAAGGGVSGGGDGGNAATTISAAPESHKRGVGSSSRQPLSNMSATVQLMHRLGGVPTGSANAVDSRRQARAGSIVELASRLSDEGGNEKERRKVSMLSKRRFATELRGRRGTRCTRCALLGGTLERVDPVNRLSIESSEPRAVGSML